MASELFETTDFGQSIKAHRHELDLTQEELANQAGCATISIRRIEAGSLRPSTQLAEQLATVLQIPEADRADFIKLARSVSNGPQTGNGEKVAEGAIDRSLDSRLWRHTEYALTLLPLFFFLIVLLVNPRYIGSLAAIEPPFIIVNFLPCGWFVFFMVLALMAASKFALQNGRRAQGEHQWYYRTGLNVFVLLFMTVPALLLILMAPALFQVMRSGALSP